MAIYRQLSIRLVFGVQIVLFRRALLVPLHLDARATRSINISEITQNSIPDLEGNIIPPAIHEGSAKITGSHADNENILISMDAGIYNVRKATCGGSCLNCDGYSNWAALLNPFGVAINGHYTVTLSAAYDAGSRYNFAATWSSGNRSIITVGSSTGTTTGISTGSTTVGGPVANIMSAPVYAPQCNPYGSCPVGYGGGGSSSGTVQRPTSLKVLSVTVLPDGASPPAGCPGSANYGVKVDIKYQVLGQNSNPIMSANMTPHETGTQFAGEPFDNPIGPVPGYPTSSATTAADGTFHDVPLGACSNLPINSPGRTSTQNITIIMPDGSTPAVRSQTFTVTAQGTQSFGHGTIKNSITSPGTGSDISATR